MIVLGSLSFLTVAGTFAVMTSDVRNAKSSIASGTLTFSDQVGTTGTICYSFNGTLNVNSSCDALSTSSTLMYPGTPVTAKVTIANDGSLDPSQLYVYMPSAPGCTETTSPGAPFTGGGHPCGLNGMQFYVQETDASWNPTTCRYPAAAGACTFNASTLYSFSQTYKTSAGPLRMGAGPTNGTSRYFIIGVQIPANDSGNTLQGLQANFPLAWGFTQ